MTKYGIQALRTFNGKSFHWADGNIYKTKIDARSFAKEYARKFGAYTRVVKVSQGYVVYARYYSINPIMETLTAALATGVGFGGGYAAVNWGVGKAKNRKKKK